MALHLGLPGDADLLLRRRLLNLVAYDAARRKGLSTAAFIRGRLERLLRPSLVFLGVWAVVQVVLHLADVGAPTGPRVWGDTTLLRGMKPPGSTIPFGPLCSWACTSSWS